MDVVSPLREAIAKLEVVVVPHVPDVIYGIPVQEAVLVPVPPYWAPMGVACQVPVAIVPIEVKEDKVATPVVALLVIVILSGT